MIFSLAFRNIFRNKERAFLALSAIAFGTAAMILAGGFVDDAVLQLRESYIRGVTGHMQICRKGFFSEGVARPFDYLIYDVPEVNSLLSASPYVGSYVGRLSFSGLLTAGDSTVSFVGLGVAPKDAKGSGSGLRIDSGEALDDSAPYGVLVGRGLAKALRLKPGTPVMLVSNTKGGALNAADVTVRGLFSTTAGDFDDRTIMLPLKTAQQLLLTDAVNTVTVMLDKTENTDAAVRAISAATAKRGLDVEINPWYAIADFAVKAVPFLRRLFLALNIILTAMVALGIFNTMNVAVMERTGEIGTMMALGTGRSKVMTLFLVEGLVLGALGGVFGVLAGYLLAPAINAFGIPMPPPPGINLAWVARIQTSGWTALGAFCVSAASAALSSLYPAFQASRKEISVAMRYNV